MSSSSSSSSNSKTASASDSDSAMECEQEVKEVYCKCEDKGKKVMRESPRCVDCKAWANTYTLSSERHLYDCTVLFICKSCVGKEYVLCEKHMVEYLKKTQMTTLLRKVYKSGREDKHYEESEVHRFCHNFIAVCGSCGKTRGGVNGRTCETYTTVKKTHGGCLNPYTDFDFMESLTPFDYYDLLEFTLE